jgi:hypothetical protein
MIPAMPLNAVEGLGRTTGAAIEDFGAFSQFSGRVFGWLFSGWFKWKNIRLLIPQFYEVGVKSSGW